MNGRFLLDTNIVVPFLNGDQDLRDKFAQNIEIYLPVVVLAELYYGAYNSSQRVSNIEKSKVSGMLFQFWIAMSSHQKFMAR
jgi:tRNA(fMet)-specific endonuclease VapC